MWGGGIFCHVAWEEIEVEREAAEAGASLYSAMLPKSHCLDPAHVARVWVPQRSLRGARAGFQSPEPAPPGCVPPSLGARWRTVILLNSALGRGVGTDWASEGESK